MIDQSPERSGIEVARQHARAGDALSVAGRSAEACDQYELALRSHPDPARIYYQLANCQWRLGRTEAETSFCRAVAANPNFAMAYAALSGWYFQHGLVDQADTTSRQAMAIAPNEPAVVHARASVLEVQGELQKAIDLLDPVIESGTTPIPIVRLFGRLCCSQDADRRSKALALIEIQLSQPGRPTRDHVRLHFTAAELLDRMGRYDDAFAHAATGNRMGKPAYDMAVHERSFDRLIEYFTREKLASLPRSTDRNETPIFIVGLPRSGTSLVEQILASHPAVHGGGELDLMFQTWTGTIGMVSRKPAEYPQCLDRLSADQVDGMSEIYLRPMTAMNHGATRITDKLPLNFLHLGLIALLLPGARVISVRRDPRDTALSCFFSLFESGNEFKFDLDQIAHFQLQHDRLMEHWKRSLDLPILEVQYEKIVTDPEQQTRRMLAFAGLPWDEKCLRFHETDRAVFSSSRQQVRRPMYGSSVGRWRNYERHLAGLDKWFGDPV